MPFNAVDIIILIPLLAMALKGLKNGLIHEFFALFGQAAAIFLGFTYIDTAGQILIGYIGMSGPWVPLFAFIAIYAIVMIIVYILIKVFNAAVQLAFLSGFNMIAGALFGMYKAALVFSVVLILLMGFNVPDEKTREGSLLYSYILPIAPGTYNAIAVVYPGVSSFREDVGAYLDNFSPTRNFAIPEFSEDD